MTESIRVKCPNCESTFKVSSANAIGRKAECPKCGDPFVVRRMRKEDAGSSGAPAAARQTEKRPRPKPAEDDWQGDDPSYYDDTDEYGVDDYDFGDDFGPDYGDEEEYGGPVLPQISSSNRKKKRKRGDSGPTSRGKKRNKGSAKEVPPGFGPIAWIAFGLGGGALGILLTTLIGYATNSFHLVALMAMATGGLVGGAVRIAAGGVDSRVTGLAAAGIAVVAIMLGKVGAFFFFTGNLLEGVDLPTLEEMVADGTTKPMMISGIASEVQDEWLESGRISEEQIDQHLESVFDETEMAEFDPEALVDEESTDEEYEEEPYDPSLDYLPSVWEEATQRWAGNSEDEQQASIERKKAEIAEVYEAGEHIAAGARIFGALVFSGINIVWPFFTALPCLVVGVLTAFKVSTEV